MSDSEENEGICPVCEKHTLAESLASQQVVLRGCQALINRDDQMIEDVFSVLTPLDGHTAISLFLMALGDLSMITGLPVEQWIEANRENLLAEQAQAE